MPKGTKDYLPDEVRRYRFIEEKFRDSLKRWGYEEIKSPTIEFVDVLSTGVGSELIDSMFKFQDFDGKILALRAEMTAPVARIVTTKMSSLPKPIRLFYISNVFRYSQTYIKRGREFWQVGVELIGCNTTKADAELLSLLVSSLRMLGLKEIRIDVGHPNLFNDLLKITGLNNEQKAILKNIITYRNEDNLEKFMEKHNFTSKLRDIFLCFSQCKTFDQLSSLNLNALKNQNVYLHFQKLLELKDILEDYNLKNFVFFDFSLTRKIEYYTGIVFEVSVPNLGLPLGGGGRYDTFIEKFGNLKLPATGFALEIEKCLQAIDAQGIQIHKKIKKKILVSSKINGIAIQTVNALRDAGFIAFLDTTNKRKNDILKYAALADINYVVFPASSLKKPIKVYDPRSNISRSLMINFFINQLRAD